MDKFIKILKNEEASNILIKEIEFVAKEIQSVDITVLHNVEQHTKQIQAALDDLNRTICDTTNCYTQDVKMQQLNSIYTAKGLMYKIVESKINTQLMVDGINEANELISVTSMNTLIDIQKNTNKLLMSLDCLLEKIKETIDDKTFSPVEFVESLLNTYIVAPNKQVKEKAQEKEHFNITERPKNRFNEQMLQCLDYLEEICQKYKFDKSIFNLNELRHTLQSDNSNNAEYIKYLKYMFDNIIVPNVNIEAKDIKTFGNKLAEALNEEYNMHTSNIGLSEKQSKDINDLNDLSHIDPFKLLTQNIKIDANDIKNVGNKIVEALNEEYDMHTNNIGLSEKQSKDMNDLNGVSHIDPLKLLAQNINIDANDVKSVRNKLAEAVNYINNYYDNSEVSENQNKNCDLYESLNMDPCKSRSFLNFV